MPAPAGAVPAALAAPGLIRLRAGPLNRGRPNREEKPLPHHSNPVLLPLNPEVLCAVWREGSWEDF
jgi:hypothetical protein